MTKTSPQPGRPEVDVRLTHLFQQALEYDTRGELDQAARLYQTVLEAEPHNFGALERLAAVCTRQRKLDEAIALMRRAHEQKPESPYVHLNLGILSHALGRPEEAMAHYEAAIALKPDFADAHFNLGVVLQALKQPTEAIACFERTLELRTDDAKAHNNLGNALHARGRYEEAKAHYEKALRIEPDYTEALFNLGNTLLALGQHKEAKASYELVLEHKPDGAEAHRNLAIVLQILGDHEQALVHCRAALALKPSDPELHNNLANSLYALNRFEDAVAEYQRAIALRADYADAHNNLGMVQMVIGQIAEARQSFEAAITLDPKRMSFYRNLTQCKIFGPADPHLRAMEEFAAETASLTPDERLNLHFALGSALADVAQHERSFEHLRAGNALKRQYVVYDEANSLAQINRTRAVFTKELMRAKAGLGDPSAVPVFILGMPRSGTTLVEQILASHPNVFAAGELDDFNHIVLSLRRRDGVAIDYPEGIAELGGGDLREIGACYLDGLHRRAPAMLRIIDKMPANWLLTGLIHLALPNAHIIHTRRDAADTCLSCFSTPFLFGQPWSYELGELGRYYRAYAETMAHWRTVLPSGVMLEIDYEDVVADLEGQARRILAYCDLSWNDACLNFHRLQRPVRTASAAQVHRPIYKSSVGRWRLHAERLRPLLDALGPELVGGRG